MPLPPPRYRTPALASTVLALLAAAPAAPQLATPELVADLVTEAPTGDAAEGSQPVPLGTLAGRILFLADDGRHGREIWSTDGTAAGTARVTDLCPGACPAEVRAYGIVGDRLFVAASDGAGHALFTSDGTPGGTRLVRRLSAPASAGVAFDGRFFFVAGAYPDLALWHSDGTPAGTVAFPTGGTVWPQDLTVFDGALFFVQSRAGEPSRLWRTDGTGTRTEPVPPSCPQSCAGPQTLGVAGDALYFAADDGRFGYEPWVLGSAWGDPVRLDSVPGAEGSVPAGARVWGDSLLLNLWQPPGVRRWFRFAGTSFEPLAALSPYGDERYSYPAATDGDLLYFVTSHGSGNELWALGPGNQPARRLAGDLLEAFGLGSPTPGFGALRGRTLLAIRRAGEAQRRLWASDGTPEGTVAIAAATPAYPPPVEASLDGALFLSLADGQGAEPWMSDGTAAGTRPLGDLKAAVSSAPDRLVALGEAVFFRAAATAADWHGDLFRGGAGQAGVLEVGGLPVSEHGFLSGPTDLAVAGGRLVVGGEASLVAVDPVTLAVEALRSPQAPFRLTPWGDRVALGDFAGQSLWVSDGTFAGTGEVFAIGESTNYCPILCPPGWPTYPRLLTPAGSRLYFTGIPATGGETLFRSDGTGTGAGTVPVALPAAGPGVPSLVAGLALGETAVFASRATEVGGARVDRLFAVAPGATAAVELLATADPLLLVAALPDRLLFARTTATGDELWATDGTPGSLARIASLGTGARMTSGPSHVDADSWPPVERSLAVGDRVFFTVVDEVAGEEPWVTDGTPAGTRRLADLHPGPRGSNPRGFTPHRFCALFAASDGERGHELWGSDGLEAFLVADLAAGPDSGSPTEATTAGETIYVAADDGVHGRELFAIPGSALTSRCARPAPLTPPEAPPGDWLRDAGVPGFRWKARLASAGFVVPGSRAACIAGTACIAGALPGRPELLLRVVGPRPNGRLWPTLVKLTPAEVEVWLRQDATGELRYYRLAATELAEGRLAGLVDRDGFAPAAATVGGAADDSPLGAEPLAAAGIDGGWLTTPRIPGFRFRTHITDSSGREMPVRQEPCLAQALCVSGAVPGRPEVFVRVLGPRPNGRLWPLVARLTPSQVEVWVEQVATGAVRHYRLPGVTPGSAALDGVLDPLGFPP